MAETRDSELSFNPDAITLPSGYKIDLFHGNLTAPINIMFSDNGDVLIADSGIVDGNGKVLRLTKQRITVVADGFNPPLTGINLYDGNLYVSHRRYITIVRPDGTRQDIIDGLPSNGDHQNNRVIFGPDNKMYFGQGTATNSGVVGKDNSWVPDNPFFHDYPGGPIILSGKNFKSSTFLEKNFPERQSKTGAYCPFNVPSSNDQFIDGLTKATGCILRANPDGTDLELIAWGLRNPFRILFDGLNRLFAANHGMDIRGSRPVANSPDEFQWIRPGFWYGWPDFTGGLPVTSPEFEPEGEPQPEFLFSNHPMQPPKPFTTFTPHSAIMGFCFNNNPSFGPIGDAYIAEFGAIVPTYTGGKPLYDVGHRVSQINMSDGKVSTFARNRTGLPASLTGEGGFERPVDAVFGPDGALYIVDFGVYSASGSVPETGAIWKITKGSL